MAEAFVPPGQSAGMLARSCTAPQDPKGKYRPKYSPLHSPNEANAPERLGTDMLCLVVGGT